MYVQAFLRKIELDFIIPCQNNCVAAVENCWNFCKKAFNNLSCHVLIEQVTKGGTLVLEFIAAPAKTLPF